MDKVAIVVSSCDYFEDCWEPFIYSLRKYWPDCRFPVYIISNFKEIANKDLVTFIKVGVDKGWASNYKKALMTLDYEYIIYFQEDYFLCNSVNNEWINRHLKYIEEHNVDYLRLEYPHNKNQRQCDRYSIDNTYYASSPLSYKFALNLQAAIWRKDILFSLLIDGQSGWDYEANVNSYVIKNHIKIKSLTVHSKIPKDWCLTYVNGTAVRKGMWTQAGYDFLIKNGFNDLAKGRRVEGKLITRLMHTYRFPFRQISAVILRILQKYKLNI